MSIVLDTDIRQKVHQHLEKNRTELIESLQQLVQIPSESGYEGPVQEHIRKKMERLGLAVDTFEADPEKVRKHPEYTESVVEREVGFKGRPNVIGKWESDSTDKGKSLLMFTHVDTVPVGDVAHWNHDPLGASIINDVMYGRGTADNKGGFGSILAALEIIKGMGLKPKADITAISVVDEEVGGAAGAVAMTQKLEEEGYTADACIYPHPLTSGLAPQIACAGGLIFNVKVKGIAAHNLNGQIGVNAIGKAIKIYQALEELDEIRANRVSYGPFERYFEASNMPVRATNLTPAMLHSGDWAYKVPAEAELTGTIGYPPNEKLEDVKAEIVDTINKVVEQDEWLSENPPEITWEWNTSAAEVSPDHPFVKVSKSNIDHITGENTPILGMPTFSDIRLSILHLDIPTLIYGPTGGNLHGADEWVNVEEWLRTVEINVLNILEWCGYEEDKKA